MVLGIDATRESTTNHTVGAGNADDFASWRFTVDGALDDDRLRELFDSLPSSLLRAKAILHLSSQADRRTIYPRVGASWRYTAGEPLGADPPISTLVLIDRTNSIDQPALDADLAACRHSITERTVTGRQSVESGLR